MAKSRTRPGADGLSRLEELRPNFERLTAERIRAESEVERLTRELDEARRNAREAFGTDEEEEIRRMIVEAEARNDAAVEDFAASLRAIEERLARLKDEA